MESIEDLNQIPKGKKITLKRPESVSNAEQQYYDMLKTYMTDSLIKRSDKLLRSIYNREIELHMIRSILINRGYDVSNVNLEVGAYHRFVQNTDEENDLYGLR